MRSSAPNTIQLGELCRRLNVRQRDARYVLERGFVPPGIEEAPASGNYRQFGPGQAFWLGLVLKLKASGVKTPLAAKIADYATQSLRGVAQNLGWDWPFHPASGRFDTEHQYFVEVGDLEAIRFLTDASPSGGGRLEDFGWHPLDRPGPPPQAPSYCVILRLNLTHLAQLVGGGFAADDG